ncbi:MAG: translation initiation factor IF-2 subunit beta [Candidatus Lokiarchaeota archaeon]|nr:translation initiation factor IF-2 subunit beta [Candidatus Lokiarchaeota archaeon]
MDDEYIKLLDHAMGQLPPDATSHERFVMVEALAFTEGNKTLIRNFKQLAEKAARDPKHMLKYIVNEVGTAGSYDEQAGRATLTGVFTKKAILDAIDKYVKDFVLCKTCGRPDTQIDKEGRQSVLVCQACGSTRAVQKL